MTCRSYCCLFCLDTVVDTAVSVANVVVIGDVTDAAVAAGAVSSA